MHHLLSSWQNLFVDEAELACGQLLVRRETEIMGQHIIGVSNANGLMYLVYCDYPRVDYPPRIDINFAVAQNCETTDEPCPPTFWSPWGPRWIDHANVDNRAMLEAFVGYVRKLKAGTKERM